jgi:hypothetical protein
MIAPIMPLLIPSEQLAGMFLNFDKPLSKQRHIAWQFAYGIHHS